MTENYIFRKDPRRRQHRLDVFVCIILTGVMICLSGWAAESPSWPEMMVSLRTGPAVPVEAGAWQRSRIFEWGRLDEDPGKVGTTSGSLGKSTFGWEQDRSVEDGAVCSFSIKRKSGVYFRRTFTVEKAVNKLLFLGGSTGINLWVNGDRVLSNDENARSYIDQYVVDVPLKKGDNEIVVGVYSVNGSSKFYFDHEDNRRDGAVERLWRTFPMECDWFLQDNQVHGEWGEGRYDARKDFQNYRDANRDAALEQQLIQKVLDELKSEELDKEFATLVRRRHSLGDPAWLEFYVNACRARRAQRLQALLKETDRIIYATHPAMGTIYLATEGNDAPKGSELRLLDLSPAALNQPFRDELLFSAKNGVVRDPELSFDGSKLLFAWRTNRKDAPETDASAETDEFADPDESTATKDVYKIFEMDWTTRALRQLTDDKTYGADFEPCYLPNGDIMFSSQRCVHEVTCGWGDCSNLYVMNGDGKYARRVGFDQTQTGFPHLLNDGRVIYTRRDYNDRGQSFAHALFVMNPDGTMQTEYYGNNSNVPTSIQHTRAIPGSSKVMGVAGGYHHSQGGKLVTVDITKGRQNYEGVDFYNWTPTPPEEVMSENYSRVGEQYAYPYPFSETSLLVSYNPIGGYLTHPSGEVIRNDEKNVMPYYLYYMTLDGRREILATNPRHSCMSAIPLRPRTRPSVRASVVDYAKDTGIFSIQNVYHGPGANGIKKGTVKKLRVVQLHYKPVTIGSGNFGKSRASVGPGRPWSGYGQASVLPVGVGSASFDAKSILGEVDVHPDGSVNFEAPARIPLYFQLVDNDGCVVQTMRSWTVLMPGEHFSCVGCHENKNSTPMPFVKVQAMNEPPQQLKPLYNISGKPFSYAKMVQPIWDKHCVSCHAPGRKAKDIDLTDTIISDNPKGGTKSTMRHFYQSYLTLLQSRKLQEKEGRVGWISSGSPNEWVNYYTRLATVELMPAYYAGSTQSGLIPMLRKKHQRVRLSDEEMAAVTAWIDLNVPFIGEYDEMANWPANEQEKYQRKMAVREAQNAIEAENIKAFLQDGQPQ